ncbi:hypothetical protein ZEAMMB73_Zm00001d025088 [Zea mays]|uniref:Neprosin PEP catalytic domain-containing protein n=1 Tax=Zea mays TaxID=4577 RepID=A0A1D6J4N2_MAIZE|nr:hypothetical protein ZEAMMB73_Zm00001d025088 [Zea mays]
MVSPELYGDSRPRLFTYWTSDTYEATGCYNALCPGFVQTSSRIAIGASISPVSSVGGAHYDMRLLVWKDSKLGNWWLRYGDQLVGYWPAQLFTLINSNNTISSPEVHVYTSTVHTAIEGRPKKRISMLSGAACSTSHLPDVVIRQRRAGWRWGSYGWKAEGTSGSADGRELWPKRRKSRKVLRSRRNTGGWRFCRGRRRSARVGFGHERMRVDGDLGDNDGGSD